MTKSNITSGGNDILVNKENFPDDNFREWLLEQDFVQNGVIAKEQIAEITEINVDYDIIQSLEGIHLFTTLIKLSCAFNQLTSLDISKNTALTYLDCSSNNQLTSLDVSKNTALTYLDCAGNLQLTTLDVSKNTALTELVCDNNQLTSLDVSNNTALKKLYCWSNQLTILDVSNNTALTALWCSSNPLTALDVSKNTALQSLWCRSYQLTNLDVSNNTALIELICGDNQLASLDVSKNTRLNTLWCYNNKIKGANMDALISRLPNTDGKLNIYDSTSETEGNVCTKSQVAAIKAKGWTPYYRVDWDWIEYEGADETTGIDATEIGNSSDFGANAVAYDLNGNRVEDWQSKKGVYIVGGKKVVVK